MSQLEPPQLVLNTKVCPQANYVRAAVAESGEETRIWMLLVAIDYASTDRPLNSNIGARNMQEFAQQCGVHHCLFLSNEKCSRDTILESIHEAGQQCGPNDYFIFYFAGYGAHVELSQSYQGARGLGLEDSRDEAYVCVNGEGFFSEDTMVTASDFSAIVKAAFHPKTRIIVLGDGCHSGTVLRLSKEEWAGREVVAITGFQDHDAPGRPGQSGLFTHMVLLAADKLCQMSLEDYSVGLIYNAILNENQKMFKNVQDIIIQVVPGFSADRMAWPLVPSSTYQAPLNVCALLSKGAQVNGHGTQPVSVWATDDEELMDALGVTRAVLDNASQEALLAPVEIQTYLHEVGGEEFLDKEDAEYIVPPKLVRSCHLSRCIQQ